MFDFLKKKKKENLDNQNEVQTDSQVKQSDVQPQSTGYDDGENNFESNGENSQTGETLPAGTIEKVNISDVNSMKVEMQFDEEIEKIINNKQYLMECYRYLKDHADELKKLLEVDEIKFDE